MAEAMAERSAGPGPVAVSEVIARAGLSRGAFHELFADPGACLLAAFDLGVERSGARMTEAYAAQPRWREGIRAALAAFLGFLEDEPALGRLCVLGAIGGGEAVLSRRAEVLELLAQVVDEGRRERPAATAGTPIVIAEGSIGAVLSVIQNRLLVDDGRPLMEQFGAMASMIVRPYLGPAAARRELLRPPPRVWRGAERETRRATAAATPASGVRITYRTTRVLTAIADYPGASNREIAERAGIVDQGQVSKLLARLASAELIANIGERSSRGAPNSWRLTPIGERARASAGADAG
jgi:AcrR family transcriptional regulator